MGDTLLDLDCVPTDELRALFRENDFSDAVYMGMDYDQLDADTVEALEHFKGLMDEHWEPLSREMGLKSDSGYYGADNPLVAMQDNMENLAAGGVLQLLEKAAEILTQFDFDDPDIEAHAKAFLYSRRRDGDADDASFHFLLCKNLVECKIALRKNVKRRNPSSEYVLSPHKLRITAVLHTHVMCILKTQYMDFAT